MNNHGMIYVSENNKHIRCMFSTFFDKKKYIQLIKYDVVKADTTLFLIYWYIIFNNL